MITPKRMKFTASVSPENKNGVAKTSARPDGKSGIRRGKLWMTILTCVIGLVLLANCSIWRGLPPISQTENATTPDSSTQVATLQLPTETPVYTPTPTPIPRVLTVCTGADPDTLYLYGGNTIAQRLILEAVYDGPIDNRSFEHQPVILEKLPDLADGDALLQPVRVKAGDVVVNVNGGAVYLEAGERVLPSGCATPDCALEYDDDTELQMDQLIVTFKLLPGLKWSDGERLTAQDSVYSFNLATGSGTPAPKSAVERTASYEALDETTIRWTGLPGFRDQSYYLNFWTPLPEHVWGQYTPSELLEAEVSARKPMGWGPYVIEEWVPGDHISLWKNPHYHRAGEGLPKFDKLIYRFVGKVGEANLDALFSGACDVLDQEASLDLLGEEIETTLELNEGGEISAHFTTGTVWERADFGIWLLSYDDGYIAGVDRPDFFSDVRMRQAIALCMDRQAIVDDVLQGLSSVMDSYLPPDHPLFNPDAVHYDFDVDAGSALLNEIGWVDHDGLPETPRLAYRVPRVIDSTPLVFIFSTTTALQRQQVAQILAESLAQCGIQAEPEYVPASELYAEGPEGALFGRRFDMAQLAWLTGVKPICELWTTDQIPGNPNIEDEEGNAVFPFGWGGINATGYSNPEYDSVCQAALGALPGQPDYTENHFQAQEIFAVELPVVPLYLRLKLSVSRPDMCGFFPDSTAFSEMWNVEAFDYGEGCP